MANNRYEDATTEVVDKVRYVIRNKFPQLNGCTIQTVMNTKKRKSGGKFVLVKLDKPNEMVRYITSDNDNPDGIDYILTIDKTVYDEMSDIDKERVIAHGLYHADCDFEKEIPYNLRACTVQTFYEEISDNQDDARWAERLELMAEGIYDRAEEEE